MKCIYILESPKDIALALLMHRTSPFPFKIVITTFTATDKYKWAKPKGMTPCFPKEEIQNIRDIIGDDLIVASSEVELDNIWKNVDICIARGREFVVLKSKAKKNIALSLTGSYFGRLYSVLPYYDNLRIFFLSKEWATTENLSLHGGYSPSDIEKIRGLFDYGDIYGYYYDYMKEYGKDKIKEELGIPLDQKVAFLSFRKAAEAESIYNNNDEFMNSVKRMIKKFKDEGYFIISRRRLGQHDLKYYSVMNYPEITRFNEIASSINKEMNGSGEFPYEIWKGLFASDVLLLADNSGICYIEAAMSRCPIYMPYTQKGLDKTLHQLLPASKDMFSQNLIFNEYSEENIKNYHQNIEPFLKKWYNYDIDKFWKEISK